MCVCDVRRQNGRSMCYYQHVAAAVATATVTLRRSLTSLSSPSRVVSTLRGVSLVAAAAAVAVVVVWRTPRRDLIVVFRRPVATTTAADAASFSSEVDSFEFIAH